MTEVLVCCEDPVNRVTEGTAPMLRTLIRLLAVTACAVVIPMVVITVAVPVGLASASVVGQDSARGMPPTPGAPGIGDPYFPTDGNGGYDVTHYDLTVDYQPATDLLTGTARIDARASQALSAFDLDLAGLTVRSVQVGGRAATWTRAGSELVVTPARPIGKGSRFSTVIRYDGVPQTIFDPQLGQEGFIHTDDGAVVIGEPHVAATWYPVNDHPSDKATYDIKITVPAGLQAISNGTLCGTRTHNGKTTWSWRAREPMASYLATATVGKFALNSYRANGISFVDAIDPDLFAPVASPTTGEHFLYSQVANFSYKRLTRTISVPAAGAQLSYWVTRDTEQDWDFTFVEARTAGADDWTTLPDIGGHTTSDVGRSCPFWLGIHPFLAHYQTDNGDGTCSPAGTTGTWSAATGKETARSTGSSTSRATPGGMSSCPSATSATIWCRGTVLSWTTSPFPPVRAARPSRTTGMYWTGGRHPAPRPAVRPTRTTGSSVRWRICRRPPVRSSRDPSPGSRRSSTFCPGRSDGTRSPRPAASSTICRAWDSPWRTRPGPSTRGPSSPIRFPATTSWCTNSLINGSATASAFSGGRTSG